MFTSDLHNPCSQLFITNFVHKFYSQLCSNQLLTTLIHHVRSQRMFRAIVRNWCSQLFFYSCCLQLPSFSCYQLVLFTTVVHNYCLQQLFTTGYFKCCSQVLFSSIANHCCSQVLSTTAVHNYYSQLLFFNNLCSQLLSCPKLFFREGLKRCESLAFGWTSADPSPLPSLLGPRYQVIL